tara:strand:- start:74 stop:451 length:378 start_codon:yes stop_codon:yes gene_type:complete
MNSQEKYIGFMKKLNGTKFNNPPMGSLSSDSIGDKEQNQRLMQNIMTAHHTGGGVGLDGFKEPSLEDLVEMVRQGKVGKEVLGDRADEFLEYGTPSQREKQLEETGSLEIPVQPFLQSFIEERKG